MGLNLDGTSQYVTLGNGVNIANTRPFHFAILFDSASLRTSGAFGALLSQGRIWYGSGSGGWTILVEAAASPRYEIGTNYAGGANLTGFSSFTIEENTGLHLVVGTIFDAGADTNFRVCNYQFSTRTFSVSTVINPAGNNDSNIGTSAAGDPFLVGAGWIGSAPNTEDYFPGYILWAAVFDGDIGSGTTLAALPLVAGYIFQGPWANISRMRWFHSYQQGHANDISPAATRRNGTLTGSPSYDYAKALVVTGLPPGGAWLAIRPQGAAGAQTITPSGIASAEAFGTARINQAIAPSGIASLEAFGGAMVKLTVQPSGIASVEAFGTAQVNQQVRPVAIDSAEAFGSPTVTVAGADQTITPSGIASLEAFGTLLVNQQIQPVGIASLEAFGTALVNQQVRPVAIDSAEAFGTLKVNQWIVTAGIASLEAFGTHVVTVAGGAQTIVPSGIASAEAFGTLLVNQQVRPSGIATAEAFGTLLVNQQVRPSGIATLEAFGTPMVRLSIRPSGIATLEAFGTLLVNQQVRPSGIASAEAFGTLVLTVIGAVLLGDIEVVIRVIGDIEVVTRRAGDIEVVTRQAGDIEVVARGGS